MESKALLDSQFTPAAVWTPDCQSKQDYDGPLISISSRAYPPGYNQGQHWSSYVALHINLPHHDYLVLRKHEVFGDTEAEMKAAAEKWVADESKALLSCLVANGYLVQKA